MSRPSPHASGASGIVVLGVFVGFQVDNWNEARKDAAQENAYLVRLHSDLLTTISRNERQFNFMMSSADRAGVVLNSLRKCSVIESDRSDFANGLFHLGKVFSVYLVQNTIEELFSTGKLDVIQNKDIKVQLDNMLEHYREISGLLPYIFDRMTPHNNYVDSNVAYKIDSPLRGEREIDWEQLEIDLKELCNDKRFYTAVATVRTYSYDLIAQNIDALEEVRKLRRLLEEEINKTSP